MRIGDQVLYRNGASIRPATVSAVVGSGASGFKRLDLALGSAITALDVPHEGDASDGQSAWALFDPARIVDADAPMIGEVVSAAMVNISKVDFSAGGAAETPDDSHDDSQG